MIVTFLEEGVPRAEHFEPLNACLTRLANRRRAEIVKQGPLARSKLAWKIATYQEGVLYRVVMLASGAAGAWNSGNLLTCYLTARAVVETVAVFEDFTDRLDEAVKVEDPGSIDALVTNRLFATRDEQLLAHAPHTAAVNVLTFINRLDRLIDGVRNNYDFSSEICHPNGFGHRQFFSEVDYSNATVTYFEPERSERFVTHMLATVGLVGLFETRFDKVARLVEQVAEIQHRVKPVRH